MRKHHFVEVPQMETHSARGLTPCEQEVARLVAEGKTDKEIARELNRSTSAVKFHVRNILRRLGLASEGRSWSGGTRFTKNNYGQSED